jgi:negative regulator of sigma E activity
VSAAPTDLELMQYADGELDEERSRAVARHLEEDAQARAKLKGLDLTGELVRHLSEQRAEGADFADAVMARIEAGDVPEDDDVPDAAPEPNDLDAVEEPEPEAREPRRSARVGPVAAPANDNARRIFGLAAIAAAVAAGLFLWGRTEPPVAERDASTTPTVVVPIETAEPAPETTATAVAKLEPIMQDPGVEVASVEFGSANGAVFYVPSDDASEPPTTVVWVTDEVGGGN